MVGAESPGITGAAALCKAPAELAGVRAQGLAVILTGHTRAMAGGGAGARVLPGVSRLTLPTSAGNVQGPPRRHEAAPTPPGTVL